MSFIRPKTLLCTQWWAHNGIVTGGPYCTAQGVTQQIGELGVALITLVCLTVFWILAHCRMTDQIITVHTFVVALWNRDVGIRACRFVFGMVALASPFIALWVGNGIHKNFVTSIFSIFSPPRLIADTFWLVLVLDWS